MKRKLEMDDVRVGMYITVLKGKMEQKIFLTPEGPIIKKQEKYNLNGKILEVVALDMPYMLVTCHESFGTRKESLDLRVIEVMALSQEYIHNFLPDLELRKDSFFDEVSDSSVEDSDTTIEEIFKDL